MTSTAVRCRGLSPRRGEGVVLARRCAFFGLLLAALLLLAGPLSASAARDPVLGDSGSRAISWVRSAWDGLLSWASPSLHYGDASGASSSAQEDDGPVDGVQWALLIAGSSGWWNYRHQADVLHAYQVLRGGGLHPDRIVLMVYDDLATNPSNPFQGQVFNRPGGPDVYAGAQIDYSGNDVNADVFLAVLEGNRSAVAGIGSGKVIASGPTDHVFVFYSDHGSPGVLGMPSGNFLYANDLLAVLERKHAARGFRELTAYIEACESGSMFEGMLGPELNVYATTAANAEESSWGTYCPGMDIPPDLTGLDTCLGDLYSVAWMEDTECEDTTVETLQDQFELVKQRTSHNFTYNMGSHVMQYGRVDMEDEPVAQYLGPRLASACMLPTDDHPADITPAGVRALLGKPRAPRCPRGSKCNALHAQAHSAHAPQREADLMPLRARVARAKTHEQRLHAQAELDAEVSRRQQVDVGLEAATAQLLTMRSASKSLMASLGWRNEHVFRMSAHQADGENRLVPDAGYVQQLLTSSSLLGRGPGTGRPLVDSWSCLKGMVAAYTDTCSPGQAMDQYAMRHTRLFANLCNAGVQPSDMAQALRRSKACPSRAAQEQSGRSSNGVAAQ